MDMLPKYIYQAQHLIAIEVVAKQPPYRYTGWATDETEEAIGITGTVGDDIDKLIFIPKKRIRDIQILNDRKHRRD